MRKSRHCVKPREAEAYHKRPSLRSSEFRTSCVLARRAGSTPSFFRAFFSPRPAPSNASATANAAPPTSTSNKAQGLTELQPRMASQALSGWGHNSDGPCDCNTELGHESQITVAVRCIEGVLATSTALDTQALQPHSSTCECCRQRAAYLHCRPS